MRLKRCVSICSLLTFLALLPGLASAQFLDRAHLGLINPLIYNGSALNDTTLSLAIAAIGSAQQGLMCTPGTWTIANNLTIPANVHLVRAPGCILSPNITRTLTINGSEEGPLMQWIVGAGSVVLGSNIPESYPQWFGAFCDGTTDDITAINKQFLAHAHPVILPGTCLIGSSINAQNNQHITLHQGAILKAKVVAWGDTGMLLASGKTNVVIDGPGMLDGNKAANPTGRMYGIYLNESSRVKIRGLTIQNMPGVDAAGTNGGDGILVYGSSLGSTDVTIEGNLLTGNVRNGIAIAMGGQIKIIKNTIEHTTGTNPGAGIDIEPDLSTTTIRDIIIHDNTFDDNNYHINQSSGDTTTDWGISIMGNTMRGARKTGSSDGGSIRVSKIGTVIQGNNIHFSNGNGIILQNSRGAVIAGNTLVGEAAANEAHGIHIFNTTDTFGIAVTANLIRTTKLTGISVTQDGSATGVLRLVNIQGNQIIDAQGAAGTGQGAISVTANAGLALTAVNIQNNQILDTRAGAARGDYGIRTNNVTAADFSTFVVEGNTVVNMALAKQLVQGGRPVVYGPVVSATSKAAADYSANPIAANASVNLTFTVMGATVGDTVLATPNGSPGVGLVWGEGYVSAADTVIVPVGNVTVGPVTPTTRTWTIVVLRHS